MADRIRIQNALLAEAKSGPWSLVRYDKDGLANTDSKNKVDPDSVLVNEVDGGFEEAEFNRRDPRQRERSRWSFLLIIDFNEGDVLCEEFEDRINSGGVLIAANPAKGEGSITISLEGVEYVHPPQKNSQSGTRVTYTFLAQQAPK